MAESDPVVIVGAGPAGACAALYLSRAGHRVIVLEARSKPGPSACGEGLMPAGVSVLESLGLAGTLRALGARPFEGISYTTRAGRAVRGHFPAGIAGLALRRQILHEVLWEAIRKASGIEFHSGEVMLSARSVEGRVVGVTTLHRSTGLRRQWRSAFTVGADGLFSRFHTLPGVRVRRPARRRFGFSSHLGGIGELSSVVEVHPFDGGEFYLTPQSGAEACIAMVEDMPCAPTRVDPQALLLSRLDSIPHLRRRMKHARVLTPVLIKGPLGATVDGAAGPGYVLIGDACGALDPITGEGVALGLCTARALASAVARHGLTDQAGLDAVGERARLESGLRLLTAALLAVSRKGWLADAAIRAAGLFPGVFADLLAFAAAP